MISIRTGLVVAAFVGMGLTAVAEHLAQATFAEPDAIEAVDAAESMPGKVIRLTEKARDLTAGIDLLPWI